MLLMRYTARGIKAHCRTIPGSAVVIELKIDASVNA